MRQVRYRAVIALDSAGEREDARHSYRSGPVKAAADTDVAESPRQYRSHTRGLMVRAPSLSPPARSRSFPAELCWDDEVPLHPGDRHVVTITVTDDDAPAFLDAGQHITLWDGGEVGHGTISRQVFTEYGPC